MEDVLHGQNCSICNPTLPNRPLDDPTDLLLECCQVCAAIMHRVLLRDFTTKFAELPYDVN